MLLKNPMVSIIIPVYNGDNFVRKAIDSALSQDYENIEVIVVNDGSNDGGKTEEAVKEYGDKVNYFHKENGGVSSALNYGISKMNGDYFSWLSHDDEYTSDKISLQIEQLRRFDFDEHIIALCGNRQIDKNSNPLEKESIQTAFEADCVIDSKIVLKRLIDLGSFYGCSLLIPRSCFIKCGEFDENLRYSQDMLMWLNIFLEDYKLIYSGKQCVLNRVHNNQLTQTGRSLFHHDCEVIGHLVIPKLVAFDPSGELVYKYALSCAKYENNNVVKECMLFSKELLTVGQKLRIRIQETYGHIRPIIRKAYYRICKRVKTQS